MAGTPFDADGGAGANLSPVASPCGAELGVLLTISLRPSTIASAGLKGLVPLSPPTLLRLFPVHLQFEPLDHVKQDLNISAAIAPGEF